MNTIYDLLQNLDIPYLRFDHPAVFSADDLALIDLEIPGADTKNLVLTDSRNYYLLVVPLFKRVNLKAIAQSLNLKKLSFAKPEILKTTLGVEPGSVTMLGLFNDYDAQLTLMIDQEIWEQESWAAHPLVNTATLVIKKSDYLKFFEYTGHVPQVIEVPSPLPESSTNQ